MAARPASAVVRMPSQTQSSKQGMLINLLSRNPAPNLLETSKTALSTYSLKDRQTSSRTVWPPMNTDKRRFLRSVSICPAIRLDTTSEQGHLRGRLTAIGRRSAIEGPRNRTLPGDGAVEIGRRAAALFYGAGEASSRAKPSSLSVSPSRRRRAPGAARRSIRRRSSAAPGRDARPCRRARTRSAPGPRSGVGAPCTTSAMSASDCSVRGPSCSTSSSDAKSCRSRSYARPARRRGA